MVKFLVAAWLVALCAASPTCARAADSSAFDQGQVHVVTSDAPKRIDWEVVVPASLDDVWSAFTTSRGLSEWVAPSASVDLRSGGSWTVGFPNAAPGGGTILSFAPKAMLAIAALAPEAFPAVRRERTLAVFTFASRGPTETSVHLLQSGWKDGKEWSDAYGYLAKGNADLLNLLYERFTSGPIDWAKLRRSGS